MPSYQVDDMNCGHCARSITAAIRAVDPDALVRLDLGRHEVYVRSIADADAIEAAIRDAGYTPVATTAAAVPPASA